MDSLKITQLQRLSTFPDDEFPVVVLNAARDLHEAEVAKDHLTGDVPFRCFGADGQGPPVEHGE